MVRIESQPTVEALARLQELENRRAAASTEEALPQGVATGYRDPAVKASIIAETHKKCAYCESKMTHTHWGDVEHILPKSVYPELLLDYSNLTLSCSICNNSKSNQHDPANPFLNPYVDEPDAFIVPLGPIMMHRPGKTRGELTISTLELNRNDLVHRREQRIRDISRLVDKYAQEPAGLLQDALLSELRKEAEASSEYSLAVRGYLSQVAIVVD